MASSPGRTSSTAPSTIITPAGGAKLTEAKRRADHTEDFDSYRHLSACFTCPLKSRCTPTKLRRVKRWGGRGRTRQDAGSARPHARGHGRATKTVEQPFGTLKAGMRAIQFLTQTPDKVRS
jgi:hypothetical protein